MTGISQLVGSRPLFSRARLRLPNGRLRPSCSSGTERRLRVPNNDSPRSQNDELGRRTMRPDTERRDQPVRPDPSWGRRAASSSTTTPTTPQQIRRPCSLGYTSIQRSYLPSLLPNASPTRLVGGTAGGSVELSVIPADPYHRFLTPPLRSAAAVPLWVTSFFLYVFSSFCLNSLL